MPRLVLAPPPGWTQVATAAGARLAGPDGVAIETEAVSAVPDDPGAWMRRLAVAAAPGWQPRVVAGLDGVTAQGWPASVQLVELLDAAGVAREVRVVALVELAWCAGAAVARCPASAWTPARRDELLDLLWQVQPRWDAAPVCLAQVLADVRAT